LDGGGPLILALMKCCRILEYFEIEKDDFIYKELMNAAEDNNTEAAGNILKTLIKNTRNKAKDMKTKGRGKTAG